MCEWELETEHKLQYFDPQTYGHQRCVFLVLQGCSTRGPGSTLLGDGFLYCILSASSLDPNYQGPNSPFGLTTSRLSPSDLQLYCLQLNWLVELNWRLLSWLSYIIVQHPLDLWNRMFNRHQAEITVMQFTGHSLPVHQSMSVSWALPCPISSANFHPCDFLS